MDFEYSDEKLEIDREEYPPLNSYHVLQQQQAPQPVISRRKKFGNCLLASCKFAIKGVMFITFLLLFVGIIFWGVNLTKDVNLHFELQRNLKMEMGGVHQQIKDIYKQLQLQNNQSQLIMMQLQSINDQLELLKSDTPPSLPVSTSTSQGTSLTEN